MITGSLMSRPREVSDSGYNFLFSRSTPDCLSEESLFQSYFLGGFECSTHCLHNGRRLDLISSTRHDKFALQDYLRLQAQGILTAREGVRWHLIEQQPGQYDFSSVRPIAEAAQATHTQVIWDLCHFGWPYHLDIFQPEFITRLAEFSAAFVRWLGEETNLAPFFVPVNEISFFSWAGAEVGIFNPHANGRGFELKRQLVRAAIASMESIWSVNPLARFAHVDPIIHVASHPDRPQDQPLAETARLLQFQSWDMLVGRVCPELGGHEKYLDILGVNFYIQNQWIFNVQEGRCAGEFRPLSRFDPTWRPFREMLQEVYARYRRPLFIAETGAEGDAREPWLQYVTTETEAAIIGGVPVEGICIYPILNHPGWDDDRHCYNGLWDYANEDGERAIHASLAAELQRARQQMEKPSRSNAFVNRF